MVKTSIDPTLFHRAAELLAGLPRDRGLRQYGCCYAIWRARKKQDPSLCADTDDEDLPTLWFKALLQPETYDTVFWYNAPVEGCTRRARSRAGARDARIIGLLLCSLLAAEGQRPTRWAHWKRATA